MQRLIELDKIPLSTDAFTHSLGIAPEDIVKYSELSRYQTIEELLPNEKDFKIIFLDWGQRIGHWVICYRLEDGYHYFNSYGFAPDKDLNVLSRCMKRILGEDTAQFARLLRKNKMDHSKYKLQGKNSSSCGRYVVSRIALLQQGYTCKEYKEYLDEMRKTNGISYDLCTCLLVPLPRKI